MIETILNCVIVNFTLLLTSLLNKFDVVLLVAVEAFRSDLLCYQFSLISNQCIRLSQTITASLLLLIGHNHVSGSAVAEQTRVG